MEAVFGAPFTGVGSQDQNSIVPLNEVNIDRDSDVPQSFDTHLFPGGVPLSTQSTQALVGSGSLLHPLVQSLSLPPATSITSLVSTLSSPREGRNSMQDRSNIRLSAGSYTVDANGSLIRDQNRAEISDSARVYPSMLNGSWADDGLPLDEFSTSFEQALGTFLRDQTNSQNRTSMPDPRGQTESLIQNQEADDNDNINDVDAGGSPAEENMVDHNEDTGQSPILREAQSETAEVSCAMATGLTISQPALENSPHPTNNMSDHGSNDAHPVTDGAEIGNVVVLETGGGAEELAQEDDAVPDANAHELNEDIDSPTLRDNHEAPEEIEFTCPPDIDPDVFRSLPPEMQQEIIHQQEVAAQISESGLDPEALAALPEDLRREVIEEEQNQQRLRDEQASRSVANPANVEEMDNAR